MVTKKQEAFHKRSFRYTTLAMNILEKIINPKFKIDGLEKLPNKPVLFVANHFTRFETFIMPYIIFKHTGRQVRCLGDSGLFRGGFGKFLKRIGAISTKDPNRNKIIISDLITGSYDWMIYPEGMMIKNKDIYHKGSFMSNTPHGINKTKTGSTVLALKSEMYRQEIIHAHNINDQTTLLKYEQNYGIKYFEELKDVDTHIVPLNITYYPIRPGVNIIQKVAQKFIKKLPTNIVEELEIEGNLLLSANINIGFGNPIRVADYSRTTRSIINKIPLLKRETKSNWVIQRLKYRLTTKFMKDIYANTKINLDHLFVAAIFKYKKDIIQIDHLKNIIYNCAMDINHVKKYRLSYSILHNNLMKMLYDELHGEFKGILNLAKTTNIVKESADGNFLQIDKSRISTKHDFNNIRTENTLQVIFNEFSLLKTANVAVQRSLNMDKKDLKKEIFKKMLRNDVKDFEQDYKKYHDSSLSKDKEVGIPFFLNSVDEKSDIGIVICHGYQSAPKEVEEMAQYCNKLGFKVYAIRLKGHGTSSKNMEDIHYEDWYDSFQKGYVALSKVCSKIVLVGFSTGGLLSLLSCARNPNDNILAVVTINAALKLQDIRARYVVPGINLWNDLLNKFNIKKATLKYVINNSENPEVNYVRNYICGVNELGGLMKECSKNLDKVQTPALIIYSKNDPIVKPIGSKIINKTIKSKIKKLKEFDLDKHIIITHNKNSVDVFKAIEKFIFKLL